MFNSLLIVEVDSSYKPISHGNCTKHSGGRPATATKEQTVMHYGAGGPLPSLADVFLFFTS